MANEAHITVDLSFAKGSVARVGPGPKSIQAAVAGTRHYYGVQNVGLVEEVLGKGDVGTIGWCYLRNLDVTNFVKVRPAAGAADFSKLLAGEVFVGRIAAAAPTIIADTAACDVEVFIVEA